MIREALEYVGDWTHFLGVLRPMMGFWIEHHGHLGFRTYWTDDVFGFWCRDHEVGIGFGGEPADTIATLIIAREQIEPRCPNCDAVLQRAGAPCLHCTIRRHPARGHRP